MFKGDSNVVRQFVWGAARQCNSLRKGIEPHQSRTTHPSTLTEFYFNALSSTHNTPVQPLPPMFPVGHHCLQNSIKALAVIMFLQVAQLMDDHVLDAHLRGDDQVRVQQDASLWRATAP